MNEEIIVISDSEDSEDSTAIIILDSPQQLSVRKYKTPPVPSSNESNIITISSKSIQSTMRMPVSWAGTVGTPRYKELRCLDSQQICSSALEEKVSTWLHHKCQTPSVINTNIAFNSPTSQPSTVPLVDNKSSILVRQDYRKPAVNTPTPILVAENLRSTNASVISSYHRRSSVDSDCINMCTNKGSDLQPQINSDSELGRTTSDTVIENATLKIESNLCGILTDNLNSTTLESVSDSLPTILDVPTKIEFCQYLQLMNMNPSGTKSVRMKQNRRSSRVKNLALMSERRALERELNSDNQEMNTPDQELKSCTDSDSSKESRGLSQRSNESVQKTVLKKKTSPRKLNNMEELKNFKENLNGVIPSKSLQVPEVSTTSTSRLKIVGTENNKSNSNSNYCSNNIDKYVCNEPLHEADRTIPFPNTPGSKSIIMTKQSFDQLNISTTKLKQEQDIRKVNCRLLKYLTAKPPEPFEDCFKSYFSSSENSKFLKKKQQIDHDVKQKNSKSSLKICINKLRSQLRSQLGKPQEFTKTKFRHRMDKLNLNERILRKRSSMQKSSKQQQKLRLYTRRRDLSKLRSGGKLKEIGINSVLLKQDRIKKVKKKFKMKATQVTPKRPGKCFKSADLIQHSSNSLPLIIDQPEAVLEEQNKTEVSPNQPELSSLRALRLQTELDMLKDLTPEHRKAIFESKKFLIMKAKENSVSKLTWNSEIHDINSKDISDKDNMKYEYIETVDNTNVECKPSFATSKATNVSLETRSEVELSRPSSADFEVDKLMSGCHLKGSQVTSKAPGTSPLTKNASYKEQWSCGSEFLKSATTTSSSLETVESDHESTNFPSDKEMLETISKSQTNNCIKNPINEEIIESSPMEEDGSSDLEEQPEIINTSSIKQRDSIYLIQDNETTIKSLHECLTQTRKKSKEKSTQRGQSDQEWDERFETEPPSKSDRKGSQSYAIHLSRSNGAVMNCFYLDFNLIVVQELLISFWNQTSLGNILGAQDMWMPKGDTKRLVLGNGCTHKDSAETVMVLDNSIAYFELWTKEHKSDKRERPVADIFVTIYLRLNGSGPDKKVLQLENINSYANDVQYIVLKTAPLIIVSWSTVNDQISTSVVHKYQLSSDYQAVTNITSMQAAAHYVSSLHNIEDNDTLIMGCGEDKITLWHTDHGYVVASMDLMAVDLQPRTLWAKSDRGFIFTLHNFNDGLLHLIATNSFDYSWKQLQVYKQESEYENLLGICIENGLVIAFYDNGILCWKAKTGELIIDTSCENNIFLPFGKHIVSIVQNKVYVRHALEYLVTLAS